MRKLIELPWQALSSRSRLRGDVSLLACVVCGLAALFYLFEYILQVSPSVMTQNLMKDLGIDAVGLGLISSFYFYAYAPMQLPAGLLYDRFGPRRMITAAIIVCSLGSLFFGLTTSMSLACAGRFFIGVGSAFSFIGVLVLIAHWFPARYFALLAGVTQLMSSIGAIMGKIPVAGWVNHSGWRSVMISLAVIGVGLAILVWCKVRDYPKDKVPHHKLQAQRRQNEFKKLLTIFSKPQTWWVAAYGFSLWAPIVVFATLWDVQYIITTYHIDAVAASRVSSMIWVGIGVGSPLLGWWSDHIGKRCLPLAMSAGLGVVASLCILYLPGVPLPLMYVLMFLYGMAASGQATCFGVVKDINEHHVVGTAIGFNNMAVVAGGAVFPVLVGKLLQANWDGVVVNGAPVYSAFNYQKALFVLPLCYLVALFISTFCIRETNCIPHHEA